MLKESGIVDDSIQEASFTGHSFRRSGVKHLARMGTPFDLIMHLSRHSSAAVHGYVEEAYEESPIEQRKFVEHATLQSQLANLAKQHDTLSKMVDGLAERLDLASQFMGQNLDEAAIMKIARRVVQPELVMNLETKKVHVWLQFPRFTIAVGH